MVVRRIKSEAPQSINRAMPKSGIQVTSHSRILIPKLLIPNPQSLATSHLKIPSQNE